MGVAVYVESQVHGRTYAGPDAGISLSKVLEKASPAGLLAGVHVYGDTMFNIVQLQKLEAELDAIAEAAPDLQSDVEALKQIFTGVIRSRGYVWLSGD